MPEPSPIEASAPPGPRPPPPPTGISPRPRPAWAPAPPMTLGRFVVDEELALGPYGMSYAGREGEGGRLVHLTVFHPGFFVEAKRRAQLERLERATRYESPHVAPTYAIGESDGRIWAAAAPTLGAPITHWRRDTPSIALADIYRVIGQLLDGLMVIHRHGGVHGSLSPETIRVVQGQTWVTSPWWLEPADVPASEVQPQRTAWLAPELLFGELADSPATDVYGAGLALGYLLACGLTEPGHSLLVQGIDVPPEVDDVYVRATARQREARYPDVASLREALEAAAGVEWRDAVAAPRGRGMRKGPASGLVGIEVLEAAPLKAKPPGRSEGSGLLKAVVSGGGRTETLIGMPAFGLPPLPEEPALVPTESVLSTVSGRGRHEFERTSEDEALPSFEATRMSFEARPAIPPAPPLPAPRRPEPEPRQPEPEPQPLDDGLPERTSPSMPAFDLPDDDPPPAPVATPPALPSEPPRLPGETPSRRSQRVTARTLPHGSSRNSGLASVLEVDFRRADPGTGPSPRPATGPSQRPTVTTSTAPVPSAVPPPLAPGADPTDSAAGLPEDVLRALLEPPPEVPVEAGAPPPLPSQTRPRWSGMNPAWGSSLEALDGPSFRGPPPVPRAPESVDAPPPTSESQELLSEPTVVEGIAPSLLEVDVFVPDTRPPVIDVFAPEVTKPKDPWSDSPLRATPADVSSATAYTQPTRHEVSVVAPLPSAPPVPILDKPITRSGRRVTQSVAPTVTTTPAALDEPRVERPMAARVERAEVREPRVLRDPSGPLAGGAATLSGTPIRSDGPMMRTDYGMVAAPAKRSKRTWYYAGAAVVVGAIVAFLLLHSSGNPKPEVLANAAAGAGAADVSGPTDDVGGPGRGDGGGESGPDVAAAGVPGASDAAAPSAPEAVVDSALAAPETETPDTAADTSMAETSVDTATPETSADTATPETTADTSGPETAADTATPETTADTSGPETVADTATPETVADAIAPSAFVPKDPSKLRCPDGMSKLKKKVEVVLADGSKVEDWEVTCIDRFEFPGAGAVPRTGVDLSGARGACIGKGKRLCTRSEWRRACGGTYPYGKDYDADKCNTAGADGAPHALVAAGSKKGCMSPSGAFDMVGNAAEWTSDGTVNGGTSLKNADDATCGSGSKRAGGAPHIGFRCCSDAKE